MATALSYLPFLEEQELAKSLHKEAVHLTRVERKKQTGVSKAAGPRGPEHWQLPL